MKRLLRHVATGIAAVLLLGGCTVDLYELPLPGGAVSGEETIEFSADFADALNVVPRTSVMVADVPVGQVESVTRVGWNARLTMRIRDDVVLPANARAEIRQTSLLGEKFVELSAPEPDPLTGSTPADVGRLGDGDLIPLERSGRNPEVEEVLGALSYVLSGGGVGQLQTITSELNQMMSGRTDEVQDTLRSLNTFVGTLDQQRDDIIAALESVNGLSATLVADKDTISDAIAAAAPAVAVLQDQHDELVQVLVELDQLGVVGTRVIDEVKDDLVAGLESLEPVLRALADTGDSLVPGLTAAASYPFPIDAADTIRGDFANVVFRLQFKLTPVSEGGLIPETLQDVVQLCRTTPAAPLCSPLGGAVEQLCAVLGSLPLCEEATVEEVAGVLANIEQGGPVPEPLAGPAPTAEPPRTLLPGLTPAPGATGSGNMIMDLLSGLFGGGAR
ncbi:virulence factor Mce family protein [Aeromicrobium marinum DSM 15272]|uniref:Virulence factor Mce family protein n=1 Tax=Aeromicrobium marinum DSM 15272 TaxID=585531 RepID=E2SEJ6_9ACTN|nr:MCE family protein [Aeromicrobium marinum]EFQ82293.1 virulence factor Mce family protein [Aeromicrobium marinum DSM 15272]